ncbi:HotDog domain-containing protein [Clohesyomyces aquaticus]|uniref:HotDog domain-containing protein n=1 Tax=Clohesyomyces aquaticus TaxID=1231657 RepID=A0A1Y1ZGI5_9PLEO|nr:HotDog domain-containing protein [Clohesyomyces aquaticus]
MWAPGLCVARSAIYRSGGTRKKFSPRLLGIKGPRGRSGVTAAATTGLQRRLLATNTTTTASPPSTSASPTTTTSATIPEPPSPKQNPPPNRKPLYIRIPLFLVLSAAFFTLGFTMSAFPALQTASDYLDPPSDAETMTMFTPDNDLHQEIESYILSHPLILSLSSNPSYIASRPHLKIPATMRAQNLTGGTLLGDDKIAVPPLQFSTRDGSTFTSIQYLGSQLCGHPGIVHGGLLATLLDEGLARCCFPALPNKVGVTASLNINYRKPVMAGQYVVLRAETTRVEGRKAWVRGWLETLPGHGEWVDESKGEGQELVNGEKEKAKGVVLVEAEALFIEPRQAATMARVYSTS